MQKFKPLNPEFADMVRNRIGGNHFMNHIGFRIHTIEAGLIEGEMDLQDEHLQQMGFLHGGVTATVADIVSGFAAYSLVDEGQGVVTSDLKVSFLNPGASRKLYARGYVIKAGSRMHFCEAELWMMHENTRIDIAKASSTMVVVIPAEMQEKSNSIRS